MSQIGTIHTDVFSMDLKISIYHIHVHIKQTGQMYKIIEYFKSVFHIAHVHLRRYLQIIVHQIVKFSCKRVLI